MKPTCPLKILTAALLALLVPACGARAAQPPDLIAAVKAGDTAKVRVLLQSTSEVRTRDARGNTALHWAALANDAPLVSSLLAAGFDPRATNSAGATPLHYGTGDEQIVRDLLRAGANPNARSGCGATPLHTGAARPESFRSVKRLLDAGAEVDATHSRPQSFLSPVSPLTLAVYYGNSRSAVYLLGHGAAPGGTNGMTPVMTAAFTGQRELLERLVRRGGMVNFDDSFAGHALNNVLYSDHRQLVPFVIARGADLHQTSTAGAEKVPPMVWSTYTETADLTAAKALLDKGVDINKPTSGGHTAHTALDWALKRGETPLVAYLRAHGATNNPPAARPKSTPQNSIPKDAASRVAVLRDSVQRALDVLQRSSDGFLANSFVQKSDCVSCHQQMLPAVAFGRAREHGFGLDDAAIARQIHAQHSSWSKERDITYEMLEPQPTAPTNLGYGLLGLKSLGYAPDEVTEAMVWYLAASQRPDGSFTDYDRRPPLEEGQFIGTALAAGALRSYPQPVKQVDVERVLAKARRWLKRAKPIDPNQQIFRLLGLGWAGAKPSELKKSVREILSAQRADGGWAPLPALASDAWATGLTLFVLHEVGGITASDERYRRGADFLLSTQFADGSWWVPSRTWPFQPHFDSGFPHGKDQWISAGGTAWAVIALLNEIEPVAKRESFPTAQELMAKYSKPATDSPTAVSVPAKATIAIADADPAFTRDIRPVFQKSCVGCHSGEKPKGALDLSTRDGFMKGGQSNEPAILPGHAERSPLLRFVRDQVVDLEMPPLNKRAKYPALTCGQVEALRIWIDQGAPWPKGVTLKAERD